MAKRRSSQRRRRGHKTGSRRSWNPLRNPTALVISMGIGLLLIGVGLLYLNQVRAMGPPLPSVEELVIEGDVVKGDTVIGVHEMGASAVPTAPIPPEGPPKLVLPERMYDFGTIPATEKVSHTFPVRNEGPGTLTISRVYTTCACTTAELSSRVIPPGKQALLKVIYDPAFHDVQGEVRRDVILEVNDPEWGGQAVVSIKANVQK